jgi:hypothetical protein
MAKLLLEIELEYDADLIHGDDPQGREWFFSSVLGVGDALAEGNELVLHSNEMGDEVGTVTVKSCRELS